MTDASDERAGDAPTSPAASDPRDAATATETRPEGETDLDALRRQVEEKYDFDNFGPADMAEMTVEEWEAAFDPNSWIVGRELLDRVEKDLLNRIARRDVFAIVERYTSEGEPRLVAYSDEGYAIVYPDGSVEGEGTVLRDVTPTVALCSMDDYEVTEPPANVGLPSPDSVPEGTGEVGNWMLQAVAFAQVLGGLGLLAAWLFTDLDTIVAPVAALFFLLVGFFLFFVVANARLSDRFRSEEYRSRLRAVGLEDGKRPDFLPPLGADGEGDPETEVRPGDESDATERPDGPAEDSRESGPQGV